MPTAQDQDSRNRATELYRTVRALLHERLGLDTFLIYGTLLGAVREGDFLGTDLGLDCAYISDHSEPAEAARQLAQVALLLIDEGYDVDTERTGLRVRDGDDSAPGLDLFHLYFDASGELCFPFGVAGSGSFTREQWDGVGEIDFAGTRVAAPAAAEPLLEHIYGTGWRQPEPGFRWDHERTRWAADGRLSEELRESAYWSNFYAHHHYDAGSTFFAAIDARPDTPGFVIDIGCGDGRDARAFAATGRQVVGLDRSEVGVRTATSDARAKQLDDRVRFMTCDVGDAAMVRDRLGDAVSRAGEQPVLFYLRFFLHSLPEPVQDTLMSALAEVARPGDFFAAEFRTDKDEAIEKVHGSHYRRFQNGPAFGRRLADEYGFAVLDEQEGRGLSPYRGEDPELYRVVARRS